MEEIEELAYKYYCKHFNLILFTTNSIRQWKESTYEYKQAWILIARTDLMS